MTGIPTDRDAYRLFAFSVETALHAQADEVGREELRLILAGRLASDAVRPPLYLLVRDDGMWHTAHPTRADAERVAAPGMTILELRQNPAARAERERLAQEAMRAQVEGRCPP
ncbi:hypothetical protein OHA38_14250 [Streptomyces sp. NBC_01732]|uniref:hypothetical protein n=1 Tax=unclassified Streptomyces TaxID=2593676 RepID=UPI00352CE861|nr:hypothetical protein OHA38_14250 [Streptomyces sp. NBC_01732]